MATGGDPAARVEQLGGDESAPFSQEQCALLREMFGTPAGLRNSAAGPHGCTSAEQEQQGHLPESGSSLPSTSTGK